MTYQNLSWVVRKILGEMEKNKNILTLRVEGVVVTDRDENDWESNWAERRFDLRKEDGGDELISESATSCSVSVIDLGNLTFLLSIWWRWSLWYSCMFKELSGKVQSGLDSWKLFCWIFRNSLSEKAEDQSTDQWVDQWMSLGNSSPTITSLFGWWWEMVLAITTIPTLNSS